MARSRGRRRRRRRLAWLPWTLLVAVGLTSMTVAVLTFSGVLFSAASGPHAHAPTTGPPGVTPSGGATRGDADGGGKAKGGVAAPASESARRRAETTASGPSRHTDTEAMAYFEWRWGPGDRAVKRITDIRTVGGYLRIYTDLPESAHDSRTAITLCRRGVEYLTKRLGRADPVVFVQARFGENGNPVLANVLGHGDRTCRVTYPKPGN